MSDLQPDLQRQIADFITSEAPNEADFQDLALAVFSYQYKHVEVVRRIADQAGKPPARVAVWQNIPAVPIAAFKQVDVLADDAGDVALAFESSGTSGKARSRAPYTAAGLELMELSVLANAAEMLLNDGRATKILVLAPSPDLAPNMIMAWGMSRLIDQFGLEGSRFLINADGMDQASFAHDLRVCEEEDTPVTLIGASFAFVHLLDGLAEAGTRYYCPKGSRLMDAGGFKTRSRTVTRGELDRLIDDRFEIPGDRSVNLLGMTELPSQFYDSVLRDGSAETRHKTNPPWTRTRVLNPATLEPAELGERGLLWHLDLANLERPMVIRTDDIGTVDAKGWNILGRLAGSDAKGCSLTVEELLQRGQLPQPAVLKKV